ncbi:radical SAM protein, partial [Albibacterium sp.]|uniref:radical SAM protein n=1 Tax=Albibacterium sp. TaxID=2952885 RepID=UPI002B50A69A
MCYFSSEDYRKKAGGILKKEELEGIAKSLFPRAFQLVIGCGAEPTLVSHYHELFALAKKYGVPDKSLVTNGQLLSKNDIEQLADSGLNELIISVHGVYRESYEYLMPGARYAHLLELLENYRQLKELRGTDCPELRINYTVNPDNLYELNDFFSVFGEFG